MPLGQAVATELVDERGQAVLGEVGAEFVVDLGHEQAEAQLQRVEALPDEMEIVVEQRQLVQRFGRALVADEVSQPGEVLVDGTHVGAYLRGLGHVALKFVVALGRQFVNRVVHGDGVAVGKFNFAHGRAS